MVGDRGDDIRIVATYGRGMGRYLSAGFIADGVLDPNNEINAIESFNGYVAYKHFWIKDKLASTFNLSGFRAYNDSSLVGAEANTIAYSLSANLKYTPVRQLMLGIEFMNAYREIEDGTNGSFNRLQISARYSFGYTNIAANEKK